MLPMSATSFCMNKPKKPYSVLGIGNDIIEIDRVKEAVSSQEKFLTRLFTEEEIAYCNKYSDPYPYFAARFAGKEAIAKALGTGFGKELAWHDIAILPASSGAPIVNLSEALTKKLSPTSIIISLSHSKHYASAVALWVE